MPTTLLNSGLTGLKFTRFAHDIAKLSDMEFKNQYGDIAIRFRIPRRRMTLGEWANFADLDAKIGCHGNHPWAIRKAGQIGNLMKIGPVDPEFYLLKIIKKKKEKIRQAEHIIIPY